MKDGSDRLVGGIPSEIEQAKDDVPSRSRQLGGLGELTSGTDLVAEVRYDATVMEERGPNEKVGGPINTAHGTFAITGGVREVEVEDPNLVLHLEDGRSFPVMIEPTDAEDGYRFELLET